MELKDLKAGDWVVRRLYDFGYSGRELMQVEKVTPSGLLKVGDYYYYLTGRARGSKKYTIIPATPEVIQEISDEKLIRTTINYMRDIKTLTVEQARAIAAILTEQN